MGMQVTNGDEKMELKMTHTRAEFLLGQCAEP